MKIFMTNFKIMMDQPGVVTLTTAVVFVFTFLGYFIILAY